MPPPPGAGAVSSTERLFSRKTLLLPGHDFPVLARIEVRHLASQNTRSRAQILFVDLAPMVDHDQDTHRRRRGTGTGNQQPHQRESLSEFQHNPRVESAPEFHKPDASMFWSASGRIQAFLFAST